MAINVLESIKINIKINIVLRPSPLPSKFGKLSGISYFNAMEYISTNQILDDQNLKS